MEKNTKTGAAVMAIILLFGVIVGSCIISLDTLRKLDGVVTINELSFKNDPSNYFLKDIYNSNVEKYIQATTQFPGNIVGPLCGYTKDKWPFIGGEKLAPMDSTGMELK